MAEVVKCVFLQRSKDYFLHRCWYQLQLHRLHRRPSHPSRRTPLPSPRNNPTATHSLPMFLTIRCDVTLSFSLSLTSSFYLTFPVMALSGLLQSCRQCVRSRHSLRCHLLSNFRTNSLTRSRLFNFLTSSPTTTCQPIRIASHAYEPINVAESCT